MRSLRIAYNERQEPLEMLLRTIDRPGDYWMQGRLLAAAAPRSEIDSVGAEDLRRLHVAIACAGDAAPGD